MDIKFERGSQDSPKGHAFVYFTSATNPNEVWASYVIMLPIAFDIAKYMPPFLIGQMGDSGIQDMSAFAFPPAPEKLGSIQQLESMADMRQDDILFAGTVNTSDIPSMMMAVGDVVQRYAALYNDLVGQVGADDPQTDEVIESNLGVNDVMYGLMSDSDKLNELTTLVGKLRFAVDNGEAALIREAEVDINLLSQHLSFDHKTDRIVSGVKRGGDDARRLTMLYVQRCFYIVQEDYIRLGQVEEQIAAIEGQD